MRSRPSNVERVPKNGTKVGCMLLSIQREKMKKILKQIWLGFTIANQNRTFGKI
jgi:hypothetical protein